jgi:hypothetical protein
MQPLAREHVYDIERSIDHVVRVTCYGLYSLCSCPMRTQHINAIWVFNTVYYISYTKSPPTNCSKMSLCYPPSRGCDELGTQGVML